MAETTHKDRPTLERKIHFYRADAGKDASGFPVPFDPFPAIKKINSLPFSEQQGRYLATIDGNALCTWIDDQSDRPKIRFGQIRRAGLPQIEEMGHLSDLDLAAAAGLVEPVHVVFFSDNIAGVDFNFYGPRIQRLGHYLRVKAGDPTPLVHFEPLLRLDVVNQLNRLRDVRIFDLKIRPSFVPAVEQADQDLGSAFAAAKRIGETEQIEIVLRPAKAVRKSFGERLREIGTSLAKRSDLKTEATKFIIGGQREDTHRVDEIDLLRDHLICRKQIFKQGARSRALDPFSAYAAIEAAYDDLEDELIAAASISR